MPDPKAYVSLNLDVDREQYRRLIAPAYKHAGIQPGEAREKDIVGAFVLDAALKTAQPQRAVTPGPQNEHPDDDRLETLGERLGRQIGESMAKAFPVLAKERVERWVHWLPTSDAPSCPAVKTDDVIVLPGYEGEHLDLPHCPKCWPEKEVPEPVIITPEWLNDALDGRGLLAMPGVTVTTTYRPKKIVIEENPNHPQAPKASAGLNPEMGTAMGRIGMDPDGNDTHAPVPQDAAEERACDWSDYRRAYGYMPSVGNHEHAAFKHGWDDGYRYGVEHVTTETKRFHDVLVEARQGGTKNVEGARVMPEQEYQLLRAEVRELRRVVTEPEGVIEVKAARGETILREVISAPVMVNTEVGLFTIMPNGTMSLLAKES